MDSQSQTRKAIGAVNHDLCPHRSRLTRVRFEYCRATFSEPRNHLTGSCKPRAPLLQILNQIAIAAAPEPFRGETAIMPIDGDAAPMACRIVRNLMEMCACFLRRQSQIAQIEQSRVHRVQRQFKQLLSLKGFKSLRRACEIPDR